MTNTARTTATKRVPDGPDAEDRARRGPVLPDHLHLRSPHSPSTAPVKTDPACILGSGSDTGVLLGTVLELIVALAGIGTAVALFPVVRRQSEGFALGFVATRIVEAAMIFIGVVSLLSLVTLRQDLGAAAGAADAPSLVTTGASLVATYNWTFLVGPEPHAGLQRPAAGHPAVPVAASCPVPCPCWDSSGRPLLIAATVADDLRRRSSSTPRWAGSRHSRSPCGSSRSASASPSRASRPRADHGRSRCRGGEPGRLGDGSPVTDRRSRRRQVRHDRRAGADRDDPSARRSSGPPGCCTAPSIGSAGGGSASRDRSPAASSG